MVAFTDERQQSKEIAAMFSFMFESNLQQRDWVVVGLAVAGTGILNSNIKFYEY